MNSDVSSMMEQDVAAKVRRQPTDAELSSIAELANRQVVMESRMREVTVHQILQLVPSIPELEAALKQRKEDLAQVREVELPNAVEATGLSEFKLKTGGMVSIKEEVYAGITKEKSEEALKWLEDTENDGIIKNEVKCPFGKGQDAEARQLIDLLTTHGLSFTNSRFVHPQTLKAFVKQQLEDGKPIPADLFGLHIKKVAQVKLPK